MRIQARQCASYWVLFGHFWNELLALILHYFCPFHSEVFTYYFVCWEPKSLGAACSNS